MEQKAIIVGANINNQEDFTNSMEELKNLVYACNIDVIAKATQQLNQVNKVYYLGKGKIEEILELVHEMDVDMVIFNDELSSTQIRNLEEILQCKLMDRTGIILEIFAKRAKTKESQMQVEIAKLQYMLPRLIGAGKDLSRQSAGYGFRNKGKGETKLELDRRKIKNRMSELSKELEALVDRRKNQRKKRKKTEIPVIALVGYTNAGKSTIMNEMVELYNPSANKKVFEKDMLFATLETSVRCINLPDNKKFLLTDTVGFISKLPHQLVKAFRSTLEEVREADMLIHVVDYSNSNYKQQIEVTKETLKELGADRIPTIYAFNKLDLVQDETFKVEENSIYVSAKNKTGINELVSEICKKVFTQYVNCNMIIPYDKGSVLSYFEDNANINLTEYKVNGVFISMECKKADCERYRQYAISI